MNEAISAHLLPICEWVSKSTNSSSISQGCLEIPGLRWLSHRSLHCFPVRSLPALRSLSWSATQLQCAVLEDVIREETISSSSWVQARRFDGLMDFGSRLFVIKGMLDLVRIIKYGFILRWHNWVVPEEVCLLLSVFPAIIGVMCIKGYVNTLITF